LFKLENDDTYVSLQVSLYVDESIQLGVNVECSTIVERDLNVDVLNGVLNDGAYTIKEYVKKS
jgi:hypothetical protein